MACGSTVFRTERVDWRHGHSRSDRGFCHRWSPRTATPPARCGRTRARTASPPRGSGSHPPAGQREGAVLAAWTQPPRPRVPIAPGRFCALAAGAPSGEPGERGSALRRRGAPAGRCARAGGSSSCLRPARAHCWFKSALRLAFIFSRRFTKCPLLTSSSSVLSRADRSSRWSFRFSALSSSSSFSAFSAADL